MSKMKGYFWPADEKNFLFYYSFKYNRELVICWTDAVAEINKTEILKQKS